MNSDSNRKSLLIIVSVASIVVSVTFLISIFARGYRLDTDNGNFKLKVTGLLSVTSKPKSASVYVDNILVTATDDTINLNPGNYQIKISKEGFFPWEKNIQIKPELVYQADAQLINLSPELRPITQSHVFNPTVSPDSTKVIFALASSSATSKENGLYLLELSELPLLPSKNTQRQLSPNLSYLDWSKFTFEFSPNSKQVIASSKTNSSTYLFSIDQTLVPKNLFDISYRLPQIKKEWAEIQNQITLEKLNKLPVEIQPHVATDSALLIFNTSEDKVIYQASDSAQITPQMTSPPPTKSTQTQQRLLKKGYYYVYSLKDDTNFLIGDTGISQISWLPYSDSVVYLQGNNIKVTEYDATNLHTIYTGSTAPTIVLATPDGYRLITSTSYPDNPLNNLYSISIRER
ncbi:MAG TPA: PEGA domain-containing protein [Candidatus Methanoperedens sp.]|nr:PEGA domain-containing protein [Candidatus Methanoperedens sp.]